MNKYTTITHRPNIDDVNLLLEEAQTLESYAQLRSKAIQGLQQPSRSRRLDVAGDVKRLFLDDGKKELNPSKSVLVRFWNAVSDEKTRRELLYTEFVRHVNIADAFVQEVLFPKLSNPRKPSEASCCFYTHAESSVKTTKKAPGVGDFTEELFPADNATIRREDVDDFLTAKLETYTPESFRKTRNHLLGMLGQFGILQAHGSGFSRTWTVRHYEPTVLGWLYAIYKEFDFLPERKRSESYFANESPTTKRFLLSYDGLRYVMRKALEEGHLDKEIFGGNPVYRLPYPDTDTFVKEFVDG